MSDPRYRILLDQNFPKPPGFDIADIDDTVEVVHVADHDPTLTELRTPDWYIYLRAARDGFNARASGLSPKDFIRLVRERHLRPIELADGVRAFRPEDIKQARTSA